MRVLVMFDLPTLTKKDLCEYRHFRNYLIKSGFVMLQESVYTKLVLNTVTANSVVDNLKKNKPRKGYVITMVITEKQFNNMEIIIGEKISEVIDSDERIVVL